MDFYAFVAMTPPPIELVTSSPTPHDVGCVLNLSDESPKLHGDRYA
jgi:hypothetical protein